MTCVSCSINEAGHGLRILLLPRTTASASWASATVSSFPDAYGYLRRPPRQQTTRAACSTSAKTGASTKTTSILPPTRASTSTQSSVTGSLSTQARLHTPSRPDGRRSLSTAVSQKDSNDTALETSNKPQPTIHDIFESKTGTWQYVVADPSTSSAVIIDPVLDYDAATQTVTTQTADSLLSLVKHKGYHVDMILETHAHADHLSAASYLQSRLSQVQGHRPPIGIGKRIDQVQQLFGQRYGVPAEEYRAVFDKLFDDDETFNVGDVVATAIHLPGHTPDHMGYKIGDNIFCGDTLVHPDIGTARCDFPGGSAIDMYRSLRNKLLAYPSHTKIWTGHDYPPQDRDQPKSWMTVGDHRRQNKHINDNITEENFVAMRKARDEILAAPKLLHPSLQINIRAGRLPEEKSGYRLLHLPLQYTPSLSTEEW